jgi:hypothetical protein
MVDEIRLDEVMLNRVLEEVDINGESANKVLFYLVAQFLEMGHRHRAEYRVVLFNGDAEPDFDDNYARYLDKKAQKLDITWNTEKCIEEE